MDPYVIGQIRKQEFSAMLTTVLLILLILLLIGALPRWPYNMGWGYYPFGGVFLILLIIVILALAGVI